MSAAPAASADIDGVIVSTDHFIGGERVSSPSTFEDRSPLDWSVKLADVARGDAATADAAVSAAVAAFPAWAALGPGGRGEIMRRLADLIDTNVERIATVECHDMAMLHESLRLRVIGRGARNFRAYADLAEAYEERVWDSNGTHNRVLRMPAGPTVVITPWNAPFMLSTWKCAPALAAGNTVVLKPAEWSPLSASILADLAHEAGMPAGVFNVVQGIGEEVGDALVRDPRLERISFTGSPETARSIGTAAAQNIVPFTAELGGKGPFIVFADADIDAAAAKAAGQYDDSGQVCLAGTRLIVEASIREEFLAGFNACTEAHVLGDSRDPTTTISPMIHPDHLARVAGFVDRARAAGDTIVRGGRTWTNPATGTEGLWYEPTLIEPSSNVVAATNLDLPEQVRRGAFRQDLYHRLDLLRLRLPPLRERREDLPDLCRHLLAGLARKYRTEPPTLTPEGRRLLLAYSWPGNVRELIHELERHLILNGASPVRFEHLDPAEKTEGSGPAAAPLPPSEAPWFHPGFSFPPEGFRLESAIRYLIDRALEQSEGNISQAARLLGVNRDYIRYRLKDGPKD